MNAALDFLRPMNWRAYFALVRFFDLFFIAYLSLVNAIMVPPILLAARHATTAKDLVAAIGTSVLFTFKWTGDLIFARLAVCVPTIFGMLLVGIVRAPLRWPTMSLLPGARVSLRRCHASAAAIVAIACAAVNHALDPATPLVAFLGFAAVGLALPLPVVNAPRGGKQNYILVAMAALLLALWFTPELRIAAQAAPALVFIAGSAVAFFCFRRGFSREWLRANADSRFMPAYRGMSGDFTANQRARQKEAWCSSKTAGRSWWRRAAGDSTLAWLEVLHFERYGAISLRRLVIGAVGMIGVPAFIGFFLVRFIGGPEAAKIAAASTIYYVICDPSKLDPAFSFMAGLVTVTLFAFSAISVALPRPGYLYTISRTKRGRTAYLSTVTNTVVLLASVFASLLLIGGIAAFVAGIHFSPKGPPHLLLGMVGTLPFLPLWQWCAFAKLTRRPGWIFCAAMAGLFASIILGVVAAISPEALFSPTRLPLFVLAVLVAQLAHYAAVQRLFRTGDFAATRG